MFENLQEQLTALDEIDAQKEAERIAHEEAVRKGMVVINQKIDKMMAENNKLERWQAQLILRIAIPFEYALRRELKDYEAKTTKKTTGGYYHE